jgi:hypothetical protein
MLARVLGAGVAIALLLLPAAALASGPALGGQFVDRGRDRGVSYKLKLTVTNDGREFQLPSYAEYGVGNCATWVDLASSSEQPAATRVRPSGRFRHEWLRGRFIKDGRVAVGSLRLSRCGRARKIGYRARLVGTPNAPVASEPARCDRATVRYVRPTGTDDAYELSEQGVGCTTARRIARRWHASCEATAMPGQVCSAGGLAACQRISGGVWRRLAGVRCTLAERPLAAVELEYHDSCAPPPLSHHEFPLDLWAINLDCATARVFPFDGLKTDEPDSPCEDTFGVFRRITCEPFAGYACWLRFVADVASGEVGRCRSLAEPWRALTFYQDYGI